MDYQDIALALILLSGFAGLYLALNPMVLVDSMGEPHDHTGHDHGNESEGFVYGSTHEHALFYLVVNGTELSFLEPEYQLAAPYVHLENNNSHIVHKHALGVTWNDFFETINVSINSMESDVCVVAKGERYCGEGLIALNGERQPDLGKEIRQGSNMVIVIGNRSERTFERYRGRQLPRQYKPSETRGRRL